MGGVCAEKQGVEEERLTLFAVLAVMVERETTAVQVYARYIPPPYCGYTGTQIEREHGSQIVQVMCERGVCV